MTQSNQLEIEKIGPYLKEHISGFGDLVDVKKFGQGQSNPTYKLVTEDKAYVLRAKPPGELLKSAHQVDREFTVMHALAETDVPVPKMLLLVDEDSPIDRMFFVMEYLEGEIFWDPALTELDETDNERRGAIYHSMCKALAALHSVDPDTVGLSDFGVPGSYFERQTSRWGKQYRASEIEPIEPMRILLKWVEDHMPEDDGEVTLVHGDYRLDNMIFKSGGSDILAVLDWELSTLGHPLADLAYQCMQWRLPNQGDFRGLGGVDRNQRGIPTEQEYVAMYCREREIGQIDNWEFYLAFSFFRLGAILQGVYKRSLDGNASNPQKAKLYGAAVPQLATIAMEIIENGS